MSSTIPGAQADPVQNTHTHARLASSTTQTGPECHLLASGSTTLPMTCSQLTPRALPLSPLSQQPLVLAGRDVQVHKCGLLQPQQLRSTAHLPPRQKCQSTPAQAGTHPVPEPPLTRSQDLPSLSG